MALQFSDYFPGAKDGMQFDIPVDLTDIVDSSGNELLEFDSNASAVNYLQIDNAAAGSAPILTATGDDTNIGLQLTPTGTALVLLGNTSTATIIAGVATINAQRGVIETGAAITAASTTAVYTFNLTNNKIHVNSVLVFQVIDQTGNGQLTVGNVTRGNGSCAIRLINLDQDTAVTGSAYVAFTVLN